MLFEYGRRHDRVTDVEQRATKPSGFGFEASPLPRNAAFRPKWLRTALVAEYFDCLGCPAPGLLLGHERVGHPRDDRVADGGLAAAMIDFQEAAGNLYSQTGPCHGA